MQINLKPLAEQVMVITGASSGIGLETARRAAGRGATVLLVARSEAALAAEVASITRDGGTADFFVADVGVWEEVRAAAAHAVQRFGRIDTWVNDAGVAIYATLADTPGDEHERLFRTNYFGVVHGCQAALAHLDRGGAIVTVASIASDMPSPVMGAYAASKHAVKAYVEVLRMELGEAGTPASVTLVKPSGIDTPVAQHAANHAGGEAQVPPPSYEPALVAEAILDAAERPTREVTVGGAGRAQVLFYQHFKGLAQKLAPKAAAAFVDPAKAQPQPSNLFEGGVRAGRVHSGENSPRRFSLYTAASRHPAMVLGAVGGLVGLALMLKRDSRPA